MDLSTALAIIRRWWLTLLIGTSVAGIVGYAVASQIEPVYESRARVLVGPINADVDTLRASSFLILTYGELIESDQVLQETIATLGLDTTVAGLRNDVSTSANDQTRFLTIRARGDDPEQAAAISETLVNQLIELATLETRRPEGALQVINAAEVDPVPISPNVPVIVALAALAGLLGTLMVVVLAELLARAVRTREELTAVVPLPSIGDVTSTQLPRLMRNVRGSGARPTAEPAAQYRDAAARLLTAGADGTPRVVLVLDTDPRDAGDMAAAWLGAAVAAAGKHVVLIDATDDEHSVTRHLKAAGKPGLSDALADPAQAWSTVVPVGDNLGLIPAGPADPDLDGALDELVRTLLSGADMVLVAAAPLGRSAATAAWLRLADVTVIAVRRYRTRRDALVDLVGAVRGATDRPVVTLLHDEEPIPARSGTGSQRAAVVDQFGGRRRLRAQRIARGGTRTGVPGRHQGP